MKLEELFNKELCIFDFDAKDKSDALLKISNLLVEKSFGKKSKKINKLFLKREKEFSTGIGESIAIPHIRDDVMTKSIVSFYKLKEEIEWISLDDKPVKYIFAISSTKENGSDHMEILANLSMKFIDDDFQKNISKVKDFAGLMKLLK